MARLVAHIAPKELAGCADYLVFRTSRFRTGEDGLASQYPFSPGWCWPLSGGSGVGGGRGGICGIIYNPWLIPDTGSATEPSGRFCILLVSPWRGTPARRDASGGAGCVALPGVYGENGLADGVAAAGGTPRFLPGGLVCKNLALPQVLLLLAARRHLLP